MLSDFENMSFENLEDAQKAFSLLLKEATAIKQNADRAVTQRKTDQDSFRSEVDELKKTLAKLAKEKDDLDNKNLINEGNFEELLEKKTEKMRVGFEEKFSELSRELEESKSGYQTLQAKYHGERIGTALRKAAEEAGVLGTAIDDVISRANGIFTVSADGSIEARDSDGNLVTVKNKQLTPNLFVKTLKDTAPHFWPASQGAGAKGGNGSGSDMPNPFDKKGNAYSLTEQAKLLNSNPELAQELKQQANGAG